MDPCIHGEDPLDQKNADGRTDRRTAFQLYIVDAYSINLCHIHKITGVFTVNDENLAQLMFSETA